MENRRSLLSTSQIERIFLNPLSIRNLLGFGFATIFLFSRHAAGMDKARPEAGVDSAIAKYGMTGKGVIVAILDRGIDWANMDFRNTDRSTRIAGILDLTDDTGASDPGNPYGVGTLYTQDQINAALNGGPALATRDALGHGTATSGIAAGNGNNAWKYRGVAYEATIISIKIVAENVPAHGDQPAETAFYDPSRIPTAIKYVRDEATALGMPAVMLLNIGSSGGPMDGTSSLCQAIDSAVGPGIPGLVFVTGASDDGGMANHASGTVAQNGTASIQFVYGQLGGLVFDLWYGNNDRFNVTIKTPHGTYGPYASPPTDTDYDNQKGSDFSYWQLGGAANFYKTAIREREIYVSLTGPTGNYTVQLQGAEASSGRFNASLNPSQEWNGSVSNYFTSFVVPGFTIWDLASATNNICPNDYVHRKNWVDINGISESMAEDPIGQLWQGTGIGPTYDGRIGIDVSAPGDSVFATYNTNSYWETFQFNLIQDGHGLYGRASATSAASPIVTGVVALMLQMNPKLDAVMVKHILQQSARADGFTGSVPNPQWGYGKVNASNALAIVQSTLPLLSGAVLANNQAQITVNQAMPGWKYVLQSSSDLHTWSLVLTNTAITNSLVMADPQVLTNNSRFYRVAIQ
jgi:minor extracellular serine protease Vpr